MKFMRDKRVLPTNTFREANSFQWRIHIGGRRTATSNYLVLYLMLIFCSLFYLSSPFFSPQAAPYFFFCSYCCALLLPLHLLVQFLTLAHTHRYRSLETNDMSFGFMVMVLWVVFLSLSDMRAQSEIDSAPSMNSIKIIFE